MDYIGAASIDLGTRFICALAGQDRAGTDRRFGIGLRPSR